MADIVERVRKLIELAASTNEHEARNAAHLACRLIREHQLRIVGGGFDTSRRPATVSVDLGDFLSAIFQTVPPMNVNEMRRRADAESAERVRKRHREEEREAFRRDRVERANKAGFQPHAWPPESQRKSSIDPLNEFEKLFEDGPQSPRKRSSVGRKR